MTTPTRRERLFDATLPPTPVRKAFADELHAYAVAHDLSDASARRMLLQVGLRRALQREHLDQVRELMGDPNGT